MKFSYIYLPIKYFGYGFPIVRLCPQAKSGAKYINGDGTISNR